MHESTVIKNVPPSEVDKLMATFKEAGATKIEQIKNPDGSYTLKVTLPDED